MSKLYVIILVVLVFSDLGVVWSAEKPQIQDLGSIPGLLIGHYKVADLPHPISWKGEGSSILYTKDTKRQSLQLVQVIDNTVSGWYEIEYDITRTTDNRNEIKHFLSRFQISLKWAIEDTRLNCIIKQVGLEEDGIPISFNPSEIFAVAYTKPPISIVRPVEQEMIDTLVLAVPSETPIVFKKMDSISSRLSQNAFPFRDQSNLKLRGTEQKVEDSVKLLPEFQNQLKLKLEESEKGKENSNTANLESKDQFKLTLDELEQEMNVEKRRLLESEIQASQYRLDKLDKSIELLGDEILRELIQPKINEIKGGRSYKRKKSKAVHEYNVLVEIEAMIKQMIESKEYRPFQFDCELFFSNWDAIFKDSICSMLPNLFLLRENELAILAELNKEFRKLIR